ncbi:MAG: DUF4159 domain-containing protein [Bryobacterales bacterium]|nr:DUF4159 domain-containing protein [Bryobacterales bacterium]MBV9396406.1 DUF4159 domain-containing protein [Bryobacterales bacterium]
MTLRRVTAEKVLWASAAVLVFAASLAAFQKPFRVYRSMEAYDDIPLPADYQEKSEWIFARLMYPPHPYARFGGGRWRRIDWREGGTSWSQDYPRADRHFAQALRRLTRINVRSVEQPINLDDDDDVFNWPFLAAGELGDWKLTESQAAKLRDYLLRGGFLYLDDFWGTQEWERFDESMKAVFPDRAIVEIEDPDAIFHTVYDLNDRYQVPGEWALRSGGTYRNDGSVPHWRGIYDDHNRLMVAMTFNNDVGDSWEWADEPNYPEKYSELGIRLGVNYVMYSLTH